MIFISSGKPSPPCPEHSRPYIGDCQSLESISWTILADPLRGFVPRLYWSCRLPNQHMADSDVDHESRRLLGRATVLRTRHSHHRAPTWS